MTANSPPTYVPAPAIVPGQAHARCCASVTIPVRNEEAAIVRCLEALERQVDLQGRLLPPDSFEVLLLLNNCTDDTFGKVVAWKAAHPAFALQVAERTLSPGEAHVGTARRLLMDTAWRRLRHVVAPRPAILATDADTVVAPDWIARNLQALAAGADVVGGRVAFLPAELAALPAGVRQCYERDRRYAALIAQLEDVLDARPGDPWPRHLDHFGSSLACTTEAYARAGGMPAVSPLEDEAFVDRVRRADCVLRHAPEVVVYTSGRLLGRAEVGMAGQLRLWETMADESAHVVPSARFLTHRFAMLRRLREVFATKQLGSLPLPTPWWRETFAEALRTEPTCPGFLAAVYCDVLIAESCEAPESQPILEAIAELELYLGLPASGLASTGGSAARYPAGVSSGSALADSRQ